MNALNSFTNISCRLATKSLSDISHSAGQRLVPEYHSLKADKLYIKLQSAVGRNHLHKSADSSAECSMQP